ncbi:MAG: methionyl-tRNA formyltransferase [Bacilli bacterium]
MKDKRVVFMGTPEYSVPVLEMLIENTNVIGVVTQPDRLVGRKKLLTPCPVKKVAMDNDIPVISPVKLKEEFQSIIDLKPDIIITCAYGQILPEELIYAPEYDTINVHASLLPKYRGGAPIHHAIINGEKETGITIMFTDKGMDSGDIIKKKAISIEENDTYDIVSEKMSLLGASLLKEVLPSIFDRTCKREKQNSSEKTIAKIIKREDERIDFAKPAKEVHNKIRGLSSVPGTYAFLEGLSVKLLLSNLEDCSNVKCKPGTITRVDRDSIYVACSDREIRILKIQISGKKQMMVKDYLNGRNDLEGKVFE